MLLNILTLFKYNYVNNIRKYKLFMYRYKIMEMLDKVFYAV